MPSPVGHSLMGYMIYRATARPGGARHWQLTTFYLVAANAPDLDFLPGLLIGDLSKFHHGPSHSVGFAILFGILASAGFSKRIRALGVGFSLYLSHVLLDYLVQDPSPPQGVPLLWPLSYEYYMAPFAFFPSFNYRANVTEPILSALFTLHNFFTVSTELLLLSPLLIFVCICTRRAEVVSKSYRCKEDFRR